MLQLTPHRRLFVATEPVDFRNGIDGLAAVCRQVLGDTPLLGAVDVFRNRAGTALKLVLYDGQGYWRSRTVHHASRCDGDGRARAPCSVPLSVLSPVVAHAVRVLDDHAPEKPCA